MAGVALLLHRNVLTLFSYDGDVREAAAHVAAGEDGCAAGVVLDRYDARFLSTEWAGGFVGCMPVCRWMRGNGDIERRCDECR